MRGAKVTLDLQDAPPVVYTDSEGIYRFTITFENDGLAGRIKVGATDYKNYDRNITLRVSDQKIGDIRLSPTLSSEVIVAVDTPTNVPSPTPEPPTDTLTLEPTHTSTSAPTDTPIPSDTPTSTPLPPTLTLTLTPTDTPIPIAIPHPTSVPPTRQAPEPIFPFKVNGDVATGGEKEITNAHPRTLEIAIGMLSQYNYSNPYLQFNAESLYNGRLFWQTEVSESGPVFIICLPDGLTGVLSIGESFEMGTPDLRETFPCP